MDRIQRRLGWEHPKGSKVVAEYWVQSADLTVITVFEAEKIKDIWAMTIDWSDLFEITIHPAIEATDGLGILGDMFSGND